MNDNSYGIDLQLGYFFGPKANWGISTGVVYFRTDGVLTVDSMHMEYQSTDFNGDTYRQVVTSTTPLTEQIQTTNINIPLLAKYRSKLSKTIGLSVDAGIVYNVQLKSSYSGGGSFNYEAIYRFVKNGETYVSEYDNNPVPDPASWLMTEAEYIKDKGDGQQAEYMEELRKQGYNVGLNRESKGSGEVTHKPGSIGWLVQPSVNFRLSEMLAVNIGPYYMFQKVLNERTTLRTKVTDKMDTYNSVLNNAMRRKQHNYGVNLGLSISF